MKIGIEMTTSEQRLSITSWWATSPDYVLAALRTHLDMAKVLWPTLRQYDIGIVTGSTTIPVTEEPLGGGNEKEP